MAGILATIGPVVFTITKACYQEFTRTMEFRWAVQERLGRKPARQWIGPGDQTVELKGTMYALMNGSDAVGCHTIDPLREAGQSGIPYDLVDGMGKVWGRFCILNVRETGSFLMDNGAPRKQEFVMELGEYGADDLGGFNVASGPGIDGNTGAASGAV